MNFPRMMGFLSFLRLLQNAERADSRRGFQDGGIKKIVERIPEPEVMDDRAEVAAYAAADFTEVNRACARRAWAAVRRATRRGGATGRRRRGRALDLGTGPAEIPIFFCRLAPGWRVTAVDASPNMLRAARANVERAGLGRRIALRRGDAKRLRGLRGRFDLVFSNSLLHHLEDPVPFWREARRLLRPGGALMVQDLLRPRTRREARRLVRLHAGEATPLLRQLFHQSLLAAFSLREVRAQLRAAGLHGLAVRRISDRHLAVSGRPRPPP
jgi:SAM-dependent methyltransferase